MSGSGDYRIAFFLAPGYMFRAEKMCPACIANAAVMAAGAGSTGILAVCIGKLRRFFKARGLGMFQKIKEK